MIAKPATRNAASIAEAARVEGAEAAIEHAISERHAEIEAQLASARNSILRGDTAVMEPLPTLMRIARRSAKQQPR